MTYIVVVDAPNPDLALLPGMTAYLDIVTSDQHDVVKLPNQALHFTPPGEERNLGRDGASRIWILKDDTPIAIDVRLGDGDQAETSVLDASIQEGDRILVGYSNRDPGWRSAFFGLAD